ncbi:MAG: T9SS type A sorting domain-containing protein, partial [Aliifodinibius sp.]|nr:T9SS type A sorting domain-containing protein [Nitrosopumilaceae archaeon]NIV15648.1 T9SS type A sorting domain-containing protein [Fodinibius sp.]NIX62693.1 T9SS type A sorting domain-containing protein [Nitrosopumilaceae archaeon]
KVGFNSKNIIVLWTAAGKPNKRKVIEDLKQNYPNLFNPFTTIEYILSEPVSVRLDLYNTTGQKIDTLINRDRRAGIYRVTFYASLLVMGIYFVKLEAG